MDKQEIIISITGSAGAGKSTLAQLFEEWLRYNNFDVENTDHNSELMQSEEHFQQNLEAVSKKTKIKIATATTRKYNFINDCDIQFEQPRYVGTWPQRTDIEVSNEDVNSFWTTLTDTNENR